MIYPSITEYRDALQFEGSLKKYGQLELVINNNGDPIFSSGNYAVVFKMRDKVTGKVYAVKCFTREQERRQQSYSLISAHLNRIHSPYLVHYEYLPDEIWVNSGTAGDGEYPAVVMEWVESKTLGEKLAELCRLSVKDEIFALACAFDRMALWLMEQSFAHGDLKTDNILVEPDGTLRLIDYDGMFTPEMSGEPARENGSPGFRHPQRSIDHFGPHIDDFSVLLISLSLHVLAENPDLNGSNHFGDAILLDEQALFHPGKGESWEAIEKLRSNPEVAQRLVMLYMAVGNPAEIRLYGINDVLAIKLGKWQSPIIDVNDFQGAITGENINNYDCRVVQSLGFWSCKAHFSEKTASWFIIVSIYDNNEPIDRKPIDVKCYGREEWFKFCTVWEIFVLEILNNCELGISGQIDIFACPVVEEAE